MLLLYVAWSYPLTKAYGPEFAKRVTDAHEKGGINEDETDHIMDLNNNAVGRNYALQEYPASSIAQQVIQDLQVVRSTSGAASEYGYQ